MYNIKLKSVPNKAKTGSQLDYSLVDRNTLFLKPNTPVDSDVKNTISAVPRDKANIEAEGGETIVGDINNDGYLEHQTIIGKRHTQGGVPLNVPEGSFIFSDTKKMTIKDPEVLAIFGMKPNKAGYTPAEIAKKYNINDFIAILKDESKDNYAKETAQIMLQSNLKKLGMLALIQESMKGFPDGVPAIAESVMGEMQGGQEAPEQEAPQEEMMEEEEQPIQRYGGSQLPKAQTGRIIYIRNQPYTVGTPDPKKLSSFLHKDSAPVYPVTGVNERGEQVTKYYSKVELDKIFNSKPYKNNQNPYDKNNTVNWDYPQSAPITSQRDLNKNLRLVTGDELEYNNTKYKVINPWGENAKDYKTSGKSWLDIFDDTKGIIHVKNLDTGEDEFLEGEDITDAYDLDKTLVKIRRGNMWKAKAKKSEDVNNASVTPPALLTPVVDTTAATANQEAQKRAAAVRDAAAKAEAEAERVRQQQAAANAQNQEKIKIKIKTPPVQNTAPSLGTINGVEITSNPNLAYGGGVHQYKFQVAGTSTAPQTPASTNPTPERKIVKYEWGEKTKKMYAIDEKGEAFETPYTKIITREIVYDPQLRKNVTRFYGAFPDDMSSKDRAAIVDSINPTSNIGVVSQHGNQRINPKNPYARFYGNTRPQDYEDRIVRANLGDQATDAMDEITKRKKAFEILGVKGVADTDLKDAAKLYNDPYFFDKQFLPAFHSKLPEDKYRPQFKDDTKIGFEYLKAYTAPPVVKKEEDSSYDEKIDIPDVKKPVPTPYNVDTGMWGQDLNNIWLQMSAPTNKYFPTMASHNYVTPGYALMDYTGQVRGIQQQTGALQNQAANTMAGNVALSASSGIAGQSMDKVADVIGNVDNANVGIVNTFSNNNAGIINKSIDMNQADKQTYLAQLSRMLNNYDKEKFFKRSRVVGAINNGLTGLQGRNYMKAMYPNVDVDPWTGVRTIHGNATPALNDDGTFAYNPYVNPYMQGASSNVDADSLYDAYMKQPGMTHQQAVDRVNLRLKSSQIKSGRPNPYVYNSYKASGNYPGAYGATADNAYGYEDPYDL
jgi:hypothetical protein